MLDSTNSAFSVALAVVLMMYWRDMQPALIEQGRDH